ncbi:MAG: DUF308 domain-containing protein [Roseovarius sp.]
MKEWLKWLLLGIVSVAFGIFVLGNSVLASLAVTTLTGILFMVAGGFQVYGSLIGSDGAVHKGFGLLLGALMLVIGVSLSFNPLEGMISLAMLVMILLAASGLVRIVLAWRMRRTRFFWLMLISGAASVLLAAFILVNFATVAPQLLGLLLGVELLFNGAGLIVLAFFVRTLRGMAGK